MLPKEKRRTWRNSVKKRSEWKLRVDSTLTSHKPIIVPQVLINILGLKHLALLDTGSTLSFISKFLLPEHATFTMGSRVYRTYGWVKMLSLGLRSSKV